MSNLSYDLWLELKYTLLLPSGCLDQHKTQLLSYIIDLLLQPTLCTELTRFQSGRYFAVDPSSCELFTLHILTFLVVCTRSMYVQGG